MEITKQPFVTGVLDTPVGGVPQLATTLTVADRLGTARVRCGIGRMSYTVEPGLYAVGNPDTGAPVLVTANYKLSFDGLRSELSGRNLWLLVLDTFGINVWCAAGKGSFGTDELVRRVQEARLNQLVSHRTLILPQLGAPGVAAHLVRKGCGFSVCYGPILASDLPEFLDRGCKATPTMRKKEFPLAERLVLIPVELVNAGKWALPIALLLVLLCGLLGHDDFWQNALHLSRWPLLMFASGILAGVVLTPLLLLSLPGRAFAVKGLFAGLVVIATVYAGSWLAGLPPWADLSGAGVIGWLLICLAISSGLGMNFTGASTYTSLSGVKKEMRFAVPVQVAAILIGAGLWLGGFFW